MKIYTTLLLAACCLLFGAAVRAQGENKVWCFGHRTGLNFNGSAPTFFEHSMEVLEGCASVSDPAGHLLFYSSGSRVWDRNGNLMPNGTALAGNTFSGMNSVAIVQSISNPQQYYVITTDEVESGQSNAYYSVVDMSLNGGLGDLLPSQSSILIDTGVTEGLTVAVMPGCTGYWIVLHRRFAPDYLAYRIDASGVAASPVVSAGIPNPSSAASYFSYFSFNNAGTKLVRAWSQNMEIASFNNVTGQLSGFSHLTFNTANFYHCAFSPDDQKLYFSGTQSAAPYAALYQLDLSLLPNTTAVQNSLTKISNASGRGLRLGPDNKLYMIRSLPASHLAQINNPNAAGAACNIDTSFMAWPSYAGSAPGGPALFLELGSNVMTYNLDTMFTAKDSVICSGTSLLLTAPSGYLTYRWSTGDTTRSISVTQSGSYEVSGRKDCFWHIDRFDLTFEHLSVNLGSDTAICSNGQLVLDAEHPNSGYLWQDGSTGRFFTVTGKGAYSVKIFKGDCVAADTILIDTFEPFLKIAEEDMLVCSDAHITLHAVAAPFSHYQWNTGGTTSDILVTQPGDYIVTATNACGTYTDSVTVAMENCDCQPFAPNAFSPNGDQVNDIFQVKINCNVTDFVMSIYNRHGQRIFTTQSPDAAWDGTFNGNQMDMGTYFYYLKFKGPRGDNFEKKGDLTLLR